MSIATAATYQINGSAMMMAQMSVGNRYFGGGGNQTATGTNNVGIGKGALVNLGTDNNVTMLSNVTQSSYANELTKSPIVIRNATTAGTTAGQSINLNVGGTLTTTTSSGTLTVTGTALKMMGAGTVTLDAGTIITTGSVDALQYKASGTIGFSGTYATGDSRTVTVLQGIIVDVS